MFQPSWPCRSNMAWVIRRSQKCPKWFQVSTSLLTHAANVKTLHLYYHYFKGVLTGKLRWHPPRIYCSKIVIDWRLAFKRVGNKRVGGIMEAFFFYQPQGLSGDTAGGADQEVTPDHHDKHTTTTSPTARPRKNFENFGPYDFPKIWAKMWVG